MYDSNVFRVKDRTQLKAQFGDDQLADFITVLSAGTGVRYAVSRQELNLLLRKDVILYSHYTDQNSDRDEASGSLSLAFFDRVKVRLDGTYAAAPESRVDYRSSAVNTKTELAGGITAGYEMTAGVGYEAGYRRSTVDYSLAQFRANEYVTDRYWETNLVPDVNQFPLDDFPMKGKNVKHMRFTLSDTTYGCHVQEFPAGSRSTFHRHGPGAIVCVTQGEGFAMVWREGEERTRFAIKPGSIYSPGDLMYHGHFNTGHGVLRHFAMRGRSPKYSQDRFRTKLHEMIPFDEEPPEIHRMFFEELKRKGVKSEISVVEE